MKKLSWALLFIMCTQLFVFPQESGAPSAGSTEPAKEKKDTKTLLRDTLGLDIDTASYFELVAWCRTLGLEDTGGRAELQQRLRAHFDISPEAQKVGTRAKRIEIRSAESSEYFSIEEVDEDYILLRGKVELVFTEEDGQTVHTIRAERILYNQSLNVISAEGNIEYSRKRGQEEEVFRGQSFIFDVKKWGGVFYKARGEREKEVEDNKILFVYTGDTISRLENETIILEKGTITSSKDIDDPNYKITAGKIWVFAPGEWAVQDAVLYVGRIPMLYVPFFFHAGDELFFHPVMGYRDREGYFLQTTTYFVGQKQTKPSVFSFLQFEEQNAEQTSPLYEQVWRGLFLHDKRKVPQQNGEKGQGTPTVAGAIKTLKLYLDFYSRLGGFTGVLLDMDPVFSLKGGLGISRSIFFGSTGYTPFYNDNEYWNSGYFFGYELPFRFGLETKFNVAAGILKKLSGSFEMYSDPFFTTDFYDRSEDMDWQEVLGIQIKEKSAQVVQSQDISALERKNISWTLDSNVSFSGLFSTPYLTTLEIKTFNFLFEWESKFVPNYSIDPTLSDPSRMFYYPKRVVFPNATLSLGGNIFTIKDTQEGTAASKQAAPAEPGLGILSPFPEKATEEQVQTKTGTEITIRTPEEQPDLPVKHTSQLFSTSLNYTFNQNITMEYPFDYSGWSTVGDIDYRTRYDSLKLDGDYWFTYNMNAWNSMVDLNVRLKLTERYKTLYDKSDSVSDPEWTALLTSSYQYSNFTTTKETTFTYKPFVANDLFSQSNITYRLYWDIYKYEYEGMQGNTPVYRDNIFLWNKQKVSQHEVSGSLVYQPFDKPNFLKITYDMPPTLGSFETELNFYVWITHTIIVNEYQQNATSGEWAFQPLSITEEVTLENYFMFKSIYRYDIENDRSKDLKNTLNLLPYQYNSGQMYLLTQVFDLNFEEDTIDKSESTLRLWFFSADFLARYMYPLNPLGRVLSTDKEFLASKLSFNLNYDTGTLYFWLNRIRMDTKISSSLNIDLQQYVASNFTFTFEFVFYIHEFLNIALKTTTINDNVYRYIPGFPQAVSRAISDDYGVTVDIPVVNPLEDLWNSFAFWDTDARYRSFFKLKDVSITVTHHLGDWDLALTFDGAFQQELQNDGSTKYEWTPIVSISLKWNPIPEINTEIHYDKDAGMTF
jgi:lipopolysaccharide assembly outer membrane protein LptD (OstA)